MIIELQRRMVEAGRIRAGEKGDKGEPRKLDKWRLTSKDTQRLNAAAELWGGEVREWEGQWQLYTQTDALPIMLLPGQEPTTWYELWSRGGCQRRCDGVSLNSEDACLCDPENRECKPYTRLSVLLPDLPGIGSWLLTSTGWNAAAELAGAADLLQRATAQGVLMPARLRLEQRVDVKAGQTRRFAVPVIDLDVSFRELLGAQGAIAPSTGLRALPSGYTPVSAPQNGVTLEAGLLAAETQTASSRSAPIPQTDDDIPFGEPVAVPVEPEPPSASPPGGGSGDLKPTKNQLKKLDVLVGELRDRRQKITTENLYAALAKARNVDVDVMIDLCPGAYTPDGVLHWAPLRSSLVRAEASSLIDRLERLEQNTQDAA